LIFSGNNFFCQKDDIQHFEIFKTAKYPNIIEISYLIPPPKNFVDGITPISKMTQTTAKKAAIRGKLSSLLYIEIDQYILLKSTGTLFFIREQN
jgi:hypothetical protein